MHVCKLSHNAVELQDTKFTPKLIEPCFIQWFGEDIRKLLVGAHMCKNNISLLNMIPYEVMTNVNMLGARMLTRVVDNLDRTFIVT